MKHRVTRFKSLSTMLKEIECFRNDKQLQTGKPFDAFGGMRPREMLANWLLCAVLNSLSQAERLTFCTDQNGGDGIILDTETDNEVATTEHVLVPNVPDRQAEDVEAQILKAIEHKQSKGGPAYASGKTLVVLLNAPGLWHPNRVARQLPQLLDFDEVWVMSRLQWFDNRHFLQVFDGGHYVYAVTCLDLSEGNAPTWCVRIGRDFSSWVVDMMQ